MSHPRVAILYPSYYTPASETDIPDCFASLEKVDYPQDAWRIFCIENPSKHGSSAPMIERDWIPQIGNSLPEIQIIQRDTDAGFTGANIDGAFAAEVWGADYIYLLNQDTVVKPDFIKRIVADAQAHPEAAVIQSRIMLKQDPERLNTQGNVLHFLGFGYSDGYKKTVEEARPERMSMFYPSGAGVLMSMKAFRHLGLFDWDYYMYHEDVEMGWRARLAGYDVRYCEDSVIAHNYQFSKSITKFFWMERNRHLTNLAYYRWRTLALMLPATIVMELGTFLFALKSGWWKEKLKSWTYFLKPEAWRWIARKRREVREYRVKSDREMLEYMVGVITAQEVESSITKYIMNPLFSAYFWGLKALVRW